MQTAARSRVVRRVAVTLAIGALTYLVTDLFEQPQILAIALSILLGSVTLIAQFLIEFEQRLAVVEEAQQVRSQRMEDLVWRAFSRINEATELIGLVETSKMETEVLTQLLRNATRITPDSSPLVFDFVQSEISRMSDFLKELADGGDVTYYGEDRDWLLGLTRNAQVSIDAISLASVDRGLWTSEMGQRYLHAQRGAAERKVAVRRVFVIDRRDEGIEPEIRRSCEEQSRMGISVRLLDRADIPVPLRVQVFDFIVFDNLMSYETTSLSMEEDARPAIAETRLVLRGSRVKERSQFFDELWELAVTPAR
ncbi:hypothetical protein J2S43_005073 [Catenuloplanes nepalensis]|uniref:Phosphatidylserine/phosphatidylglycerophosphate/ cardiolipin synthase family protein n=1 Tax=Catenuloplanes nepalensis TaxID=587533 RepID=A0ABT9MZD8_9ACTN|nr:hypothetical protein [Catenuloplanes nepalensis]MDP9796561.1 hypothetical protein [Catenuloplanes nepalensis]